MVVRQREARWAAAVDVLRLVRTEPGITRTALARQLDLSSGTATELVARLRDRRLLAEDPAPVTGRGRPTTILHAHPDGPLLLVIDVRPSGWIAGVVRLDGTILRTLGGRSNRNAPETIALLGRTVEGARAQLGDRLRLISVAVSGTVAGTRVVQAGVLGWEDIDLGPIAGGLPLLVGNDATLAAVAETARGASRGARVGVHLLVDAGMGGALTIDGRPLGGRSGEFGHLPFGDPRLRCTCGAYGCWETGLDGRAIARFLGEPIPEDSRAYTMEVLRRTDPSARGALGRVAAVLGRGTAGLVNAHDPDIVTLGGIAGPLRAADPAAFAEAYLGSLMSFHRADPPPVVDAAFGTDGGLQGAIDIGLTQLTTAEMLDAWTATNGRSAPADAYGAATVENTTVASAQR